MAGLFDECLPLSYYYEKLNLERFEIKENRNTIASIAAGSLVGVRLSFHRFYLVLFLVCYWLVVSH
jgi:hypothetical protein